MIILCSQQDFSCNHPFFFLERHRRSEVRNDGVTKPGKLKKTAREKPAHYIRCRTVRPPTLIFTFLNSRSDGSLMVGNLTFYT